MNSFWMNITARLRWLCCYASLGLPDGLFIMACRIPWKERRGAALVAAMPESPATGEISLDEQGLQQVVADFDSSRAAVTASYLQAIALWNAGKEDEGVAKMKAFIDSAPTEEWKAQASVTLVSPSDEPGKADEAEGLFRSVVDAGDPTFSGFATMCLGTLPGLRKDNAAAGVFYR